VYSALFFLLLALIDGGMGVFHYQQVACQAREAARWASVRGSGWQAETGQTSPTQGSILTNVVAPLEIGMTSAQVKLQVDWIDGSSGQATSWDSSTKAPTSTTSGGNVVTNRVRATVSYAWTPSFFRVGPFTLKSVSEIPMSF
jgi:hypothetical protein